MNVNVNVGTPLAAEFPSDALGNCLAPDSEPVVAVVKWFRADKGYGFIDVNDGKGDAFLHLKVLRSLGLETVAPGTTIRVAVDSGPRGRQVARVLDVDDSTSSDETVSTRSAGRPMRDLASTTELTGKVKWFDDIRGFGFVASDDFGGDVFVHCTILRRAKIAGLVGGQTVTMRVIETAKGREAVEITA